jgi:V/A-type H+-transporting ATPase subunit I
MPVGQIKRLHLLVHGSRSDELIRDLHKLGCVQIEDVGETPPTEWEGLVREVSFEVRDLERRLSDLEAAIGLLASHAPSGGLLGGGRFRLTPSQMDQLVAGLDVNATVSEVRRLDQRESERKAAEAHWRMLEEHLEPWKDMTVPLHEIGPTSRTTVSAGSVPETAVSALEAGLAGEHTVHWEVVSRGAGEVYVLLILLREVTDRIAPVLKEAGFTSANFHGLEGTAGEILGEARNQLAQLSQERLADEQKAQALARHRPALMVAADQVRHELERASAARQLAATGSTVVLRGWVRSRDVPSIEAAAGEEAAVLVSDPLEGEDVPVELENRPLVRPFQVVTGLYGLPRYREIDPTPYLAPFFALSFGLALGEGGYGVLMVLLSVIGLRYLHLSRSMRQLLRLLFLCGVSTFVLGTLMGSFFAINFDAAPASLGWLVAIHRRLKLLDPLKDSMAFLFIVLGIGLIQVWIGVLIRAVDRFRSGHRVLAILHEGAWLVALPVAPLAVAGVRILGTDPLTVLAIAGVSIFLTAGAGSGGIGARIGAGLYALYGAVGFFGDILSYSRLFALGLATGVVAMVVNILAGMVRGIPLVGWVVMVVLLVFGHLFNLAINALGAFIHTARLQFVEFFTKFFEGGGKSFAPFKEEGRYTEVVASEGG